MLGVVLFNNDGILSQTFAPGGQVLMNEEY